MPGQIGLCAWWYRWRYRVGVPMLLVVCGAPWGTLNAQAVFIEWDHGSGLGIARLVRGRCFILVPAHVVDRATGSIAITATRQTEPATAYIAMNYQAIDEADLAVLVEVNRQAGTLATVCRHSTQDRPKVDPAQLWLREGTGGSRYLPIQVEASTDTRPRTFEIRLSDQAVTLADGMSGGAIVQSGEIVGMLYAAGRPDPLNPGNRIGRAYSMDYIDATIEGFLGQNTPALVPLRRESVGVSAVIFLVPQRATTPVGTERLSGTVSINAPVVRGLSLRISGAAFSKSTPGTGQAVPGTSSALFLLAGLEASVGFPRLSLHPVVAIGPGKIWQRNDVGGYTTRSGGVDTYHPAWIVTSSTSASAYVGVGVWFAIVRPVQLIGDAGYWAPFAAQRLRGVRLGLGARVAP